MHMTPPFLLCLGDAKEDGYIKTALGLVQWRPEDCIGELRLPDCQVTTGLPELNVNAAKQAGAKTLVIGVAPAGGRLPEHWLPMLIEALDAGLDIASGLHDKLNNNPRLANKAREVGRQLLDLRVVPQAINAASGIRRSGRRLLTVGTDCAIGKKYTALAIHRAFQSAGLNSDFRATGQTGIMIAGQGIAIDSTVADFTAAAAESLSPDNDSSHWDIIEGQGALFHPAYAAVTVGLMHGSQPDAMVLCHEAGRKQILGWPQYQLPNLKDCIAAYELLARVTNPQAKIVALSINTATLDEKNYLPYLEQLTKQLGLLTFDPLRQGADVMVPLLQND